MMLLFKCSNIQVCYLALYGILLYKSMSWKKLPWRIENIKSMPTRSIISKKTPYASVHSPKRQPIPYIDLITTIIVKIIVRHIRAQQGLASVKSRGFQSDDACPSPQPVWECRQA